MTSMVNLNIMNPELRDPSRRIRRASEAVGKVELNLGIRLVHRRRLLSLDDTHTVRCRRVSMEKMGFREMFPRTVEENDVETFRSLVSSDWDLNRHVQWEIDGNIYMFTPLQLAARRGSVEMITLLLSRPVNVNMESDEHPYDLLDRVSSTGTHGHGPHAKELKLTPVNVAAFHGHCEVVDLLCKSGANLLLKDAYGRTAFANACLRGHLEVVRHLENYAAIGQFDIPDRWGQRPAMLACYSGNEDLLVWLIGKGLASDLDTFQGISPLEVAVTQGHSGILKTLLAAGYSVSSKRSKFTRPLHFLAAAHGHTEVLKLLLKVGCSPTDTIEYGQTLLHVAATKGQVEVVKHLVRIGIGVNKMDNECNTALCCAISEKHIDVVRLLVEAGTDLNKPPSPRRPPLTIAIDQASKEITEILCYGGAGINKRDLLERTPLMHAIAEDSPMNSLESRRMSLQRVTKCNDVCSILIGRGCDLNARDVEGNTALHLALMQGNLQLVNELLEHGCRFDIANNRPGRTPLHVAVSKGDVASTELLLRYGCDINAKNGDGETAIQMLSKVRVVQSNLGQIHCLQVNNRKMESLFRVLLCGGAVWPPGVPLTHRRLREIYQEMMPLSLLHSCRIAIRRALASNFQSKVAKLPLPPTVKRFLLFDL